LLYNTSNKEIPYMNVKDIGGRC